MSYQANVFHLMLASPSDVQKERQIAKEVIFEWNAVNSIDRSTCLLPVGWEHNLGPEMGNEPQSIINKYLLKDSDMLIGIFGLGLEVQLAILEVAQLKKLKNI